TRRRESPDAGGRRAETHGPARSSARDLRWAMACAKIHAARASSIKPRRIIAKTPARLAACALALSAIAAPQVMWAQDNGQPAPPGQPIGAAADALAQQGLELLNTGKLGDAATAYRSLLDRYPNSGAVAEAWFRLGYIQYVQADFM